MITKPRPKTMSQTIKAVGSYYQGRSTNMTDIESVRGFVNSFIDSGLRYRPAGVSKREAFKALSDHLMENTTSFMKPIVKKEIEAFSGCITTPIGELARSVGRSEAEFLSGKI